MLDPFSRGAIIALSALCVAGAFALAPTRARGSIAQTPLQLSPLAVETASDAVTSVPIRRDPFAESAAPAVPAVTIPSASSPRGTIGPLPSNLTNDVIPAIPGTAADPLVAGTAAEPLVAGTAADPLVADARVTAIVTGAHPFAMLDMGQVHEIKGIGDRIAGSTIVSIDLGGVRLQNGRRLSVGAAGRP